jgi:Fe-S cluster assembly scaffold protein SufB
MTTQILELQSDTQVIVKEDTQYVLRFPSFDRGSTYAVTLHFETQGTSAEIIGVYKLTNDQFLDLTTTTVHAVPNTSCITTIRGALFDKAFSKYRGEIIIEKPAQQTSSFLRDDVLLLGEGALSRSDPTLKIEADDVKASHGATTGGIDENQSYYLMSRGLTKTEAERVITQGFFAELMNKITDEKIRAQIQTELGVGGQTELEE